MRNGDGPGKSEGSNTSTKPWSITRRLTVLYTLSSFVMLVIYTLIMYYSIVDNFAKEDTETLAEKINYLRAVVKAPPDFLNRLGEEFILEGGHSGKYAKYFARVLDKESRVLIETPSINNLDAAPPFPGPDSNSQKTVKWKSPDGRYFLLMAAVAESGSGGGGMRIIQVALDVTNEKKLITNYNHRLLVLLTFGIFFCAGIGITVARRVLRPMEKITEITDRITAEQIEERINPEQWPSELRALATSFNRMLTRLEESFTRLSRFSADLAHELRTPINNLMGEAELAVSRECTPTEYRNVLSSSLEELGRLTHLIDSLLFLARAENPATRIECSRFDAYEMVNKVCDYFEWLADDHGVKITCSGSGVMTADLLLVRRSVSNLVANALQYTSIGEEIEIAVRQPDDHSLEIMVRDTGQGIAAEHIPHIFDRFYRADAARSSYPQGTGLGLAIVKSIMDLHGGAIDIRSEQGRGTTVTLRFNCFEANGKK